MRKYAIFPDRNRGNHIAQVPISVDVRDVATLRRRTWAQIGQKALLGCAFALLSLAPGCALLLGLDEFEDAEPAPAGQPSCAEGDVVSCYGGPPKTQGVGLCRAGTQTCLDDGAGWSECTGETLPEQEQCATVDDENCDGADCGIWAMLFENETAHVRAMGVDAEGHVVLAGEFNNSIRFGGETLESADRALFLARFDRAGNHLWSKAFASPAAPYLRGLAVDSGGNIVIVGLNLSLNAPVNFGGNDLGRGLLVAKFDAAGAHIWSRGVAGSFPDYENSGPSVALDPEGDVIVVGIFSGPIDFGNGPLEPSDSTDIFVAKLAASDGSALESEGGWSRRFGGSSLDKASAVAVDTVGAIFLSGKVYGSGPIEFGNEPPVAGPFLVKLSGHGNPLWSRGFATGLITDLVVDGEGSPILTGSYSGALDFGGGELPQDGGGFVVKFDAQGIHQWSRAFTSSGTVSARAVAVDPMDQQVVATGDFSVDGNFGGGVILAGLDVYAVKLGASGKHLWSRRFGGDGIQAGLDVAVSPEGEILLAGESGGSIDFGTGPLTSASKGLFLAKLGL